MVFSRGHLWRIALLWGALAVPGFGAVSIEGISLYQFKLPKKTAFVTSKGSSDSCPGIFIVIKAKSESREFTSVGEILPRALVTNEISKDAWSGALAFRGSLLGKSLPGATLEADRQAIASWMDDLFALAEKQVLETRTPPRDGHKLRATLCGYDMALLDLVGQIHDVPIATVLGGAARQEVAISATTYGADMAEEDVEEKLDTTNDSYKAVRIKIGLNIDSDLKKLHAAAEAMVAEGKGREIWVDVNQAWKTGDNAIAMLDRVRGVLKETGFTSRFICEQPTSESNMAALAAVTKQTREWAKTDPFKIITMADEAMWDAQDAAELVKLNAADAVNIKIVKAGGLLKSLEIGQYLAKNAPAIEVYVGGLIMTDISATANLQLCLALPKLDYATGPLPRPHSYPAQPASQPLAYAHDRSLKVPSTPGLGTGLDLEAMKPFLVKTYPEQKP